LRKGEKLVTFLTIHFTFQFCVFSCQMLVASVSSQHDSEISSSSFGFGAACQNPSLIFVLAETFSSMIRIRCHNKYKFNLRKHFAHKKSKLIK
jgi:hypothetical protein